MTTGKILYKTFLIAATVIVAGGITVLLIAANKRNVLKVCTGVSVSITAESGINYVNKDEVLFAMEKFNKAALLNQPVQKIDLPALEKMLESGQWIKDAQLYFDSKNVLNVLIKERTPIARVLTVAGTSFFIDEEGKQLPVLQDKVIRLQTITGFIAAKKWNASDSALFRDVKNVVRYISDNSFWNAQIGQIDITPSGNFELIPVIGDHVIKIGRGENIDQKMQSLLLFYRQVLAKTGFNKYAAIDLQYAGQVIGVKKEQTNAVDSIVFQEKINALLSKAENIQAVQDEEIQQNIQPAEAKEQNKPQNIKPLEKPFVPVKTKPNPIENKVSSNPIPLKKTQVPPTTTEKPQPTEKQPKAVMPKRTDEQ